MSDPVPDKREVPWYLRSGSVLVSFLIVGPLAIPLVWAKPDFTIRKKVIWTVVMVAVTWALVTYAAGVFSKVIGQYKELGLIQ
jgi:hypothetical protein